MIEIDGSQLEGGGQIVRLCLAIACIKKLPVRIVNIRAGRQKPGLAAQHSEGVRLVNRISNGRLVGGEIGSCSLEFTPGNGQINQSYEADPKTAGSITMMAQISLPCVLQLTPTAENNTTEIFPVTLELFGGTNVTQSPPIDFYKYVLLPYLNHFGISAQLRYLSGCIAKLWHH